MKLQPTSATPPTILSEVLANLAFMFASEEPADPGQAARWWEADIAYRGPQCGQLRLQCTPDFARLLAANLLGVDAQEEAAAVKAQDSVKELMNIFCGQFVTTVHGRESVFDLSLPRVRELPAPPADGGHVQGNWATIHVEGHPVRITHEVGPCA